MNYLLLSILIILSIVIIIAALSIKVVPHKEAWIIERLGKFHRVVESGIHLIYPFLDTVKAKLSLKEQVLDVPKQDVITKDNVVVEVDAICYYKIILPEKAFYNIEDLESAIEQTIQTSVRDIVGTFSLDDLLSARDEINERVREQLGEISKEWGVIIRRVELKEINPPPDIIEAMTKLIEADRTKKAMITEAEGKKKAIELEAEAFKFKKIKEAEALKEFGEAQAVAVQKLVNLVGDPQLATLLIVGDSYLNALKDMSTTESSKMVILPPNIESLIDMLNRRRGNDGGNTS